MVFSSSYNSDQREFITGLTRVLNPSYVLEFGTQQGSSAIALGKGMSAGSTLVTYDLFEPQYDKPPYGDTHSNWELAFNNIAAADLLCDVKVKKGSAGDWFDQDKRGIDLLHIDICNHYDNVSQILTPLHGWINGVILLEGGIENRWQKEHGFSSYLPLLPPWKYITIPFNDHNAITIVDTQGDK
tara:strand:- start:4997 stop:5551 length:555 start_codon:yes stop_codon:yes gene_type:complete